jgi:hypothetical protein
MATSTKTRKPPTQAQTDKVLDAINLRYAVEQMANRQVVTEREYQHVLDASEFDSAAYERLIRRGRWQQAALKRLLDAGLSAYKAEVYR